MSFDVRCSKLTLAGLIAMTLTPAPLFSQISANSTAVTSASNDATKACEAAEAAKISLVDGVSVASVCTTVVGAWKGRTTKPNPPRLYKLTEQNQAFGDNLSASIRAVNGRRNVIVDVDLPTSVTVSDLRTAVAPNYNVSELGIWLDRIDEHEGVIEKKDTEAAAFIPLAFEWIGKPVIQFLINTFFKRDPYSASRRVDAVVRTYGSGPNAGAIRRICFVPIGRKNDRNICPV
ncbi:hypothetical protein NZL82_13020 [Sphingomonas sanguinis]|uniref:hypothetical protein n=1 Tax=Sphingomonas sp. LC-1 TaxID=3110957 RepID=UPI0021BAFBF5|nr:hypothetical protein [Sphingomonas sp. LC-1]MCT8002796.1 hypothetical protein [Sphingomonas sp. LC-1]